MLIYYVDRTKIQSGCQLNQKITTEICINLRTVGWHTKRTKCVFIIILVKIFILSFAFVYLAFVIIALYTIHLYIYTYSRAFIAAVHTLWNAITCIINGNTFTRMARKLKTATLLGTFVIIISHISIADSCSGHNCRCCFSLLLLLLPKEIQKRKKRAKMKNKK